MKKVNATICTGQNCYTKGAALFKQLDNIMSVRIKNSITLTGSDCPGYCAECGASQAPCARVDGRLTTRARPAEVLLTTRECLA
ncbi:thioredoxin domain-containing protein [Pontiella sulfatireligans]|uniref:Uncharacterized protein n=1 Tax=Pontiella sulfatireligans TaxID=2750658 RepID=A0A6C2ULJ3_9BACT|nr:hypothetical protein [Pontiella sulfatireligans]VGO20773.1 hypothetical protein SCARR_02840 [Pontiella sulfatireligans]